MFIEDYKEYRISKTGYQYRVYKLPDGGNWNAGIRFDTIAAARASIDGEIDMQARLEASRQASLDRRTAAPLNGNRGFSLMRG